MECATITIYTSQCVQMDPKQLPEMSKLYSICNKCVMQENVGEVDTNPTLVSLTVTLRVLCSVELKYHIARYDTLEDSQLT